MASQVRQAAMLSPSRRAAPAAGWQLLLEAPFSRAAGSRRWPNPELLQGRGRHIPSARTARRNRADSRRGGRGRGPSSSIPTMSSAPRPCPGRQRTAGERSFGLSGDEQVGKCSQAGSGGKRQFATRVSRSLNRLAQRLGRGEPVRLVARPEVPAILLWPGLTRVVPPRWTGPERPVRGGSRRSAGGCNRGNDYVGSGMVGGRRG